MIEITTGTIEERVIRILQKKYPITTREIASELKTSEDIIKRVIHKFYSKHIVDIDVLPDKTFIRLLRNDFSFNTKKRQKKFIKHKSTKRKTRNKEYEGIMYS